MQHRCDAVLFHTLPAAEAYARDAGVIHPIDDRNGSVIGYRVELEEAERINRRALEAARLRLENDRGLYSEVMHFTLAKAVALAQELSEHPRSTIVQKVAAKFSVSERTVERAIAEEQKLLAPLRRNSEKVK